MSQSRAEILMLIVGILRRLNLLNDTDQIDEQTGLLGKGIGLDSVEILQVVVGIEEEFNLTIDEGELSPDYFRSVADLITFIEGKLS
ncbi:MAG: acyl carrier protein [Candidatus Hodarchaeota archaeon]